MEKNQKRKNESIQLGIIYPNSAGLDVGSMNMVVSYQGLNQESVVKEYGSYTEELHDMAHALKSAGVTHVAMEATGIHRIAEGKQDPESILEGVNLKQLKASKENLIKSLTGVFKPHYITILNHHLEAHQFYKQQMLSYEQEIESLLKKLIPQKAQIQPKKSHVRKNQYHFNLKEYLHQLVGVDLTEIDGLDENTLLTIISVVGLNMNKWPTGDHFTSWLNLAARPKISGGKTLGHQKRFTNNPATQAFRMAAQTMWQNKGNLGHLYRRLSASKGSKKAIKAVARKLAIIFYNMVKKKTVYDPKIVALDLEQIRAKKIERLKKEAEKLGCKISIAAA